MDGKKVDYMVKIKKLNYTEDVYDIEVDKNHNFYANGILVHNCEIALVTSPLRHIDDDGTDLVKVEVKKENLEEYLSWRSKQGKVIDSIVA